MKSASLNSSASRSLVEERLLDWRARLGQLVELGQVVPVVDVGGLAVGVQLVAGGELAVVPHLLVALTLARAVGERVEHLAVPLPVPLVALPTQKKEGMRLSIAARLVVFHRQVAARKGRQQDFHCTAMK